VPLVVVDCLETTDIHEGEDESPVRAASAGNLPLEINQAAIPAKGSGRDVNARLGAVAGSLASIAGGSLTIA